MAVSVCGRSGMWPFRFVTISICGPSGLWPFRSVAPRPSPFTVCGLLGLWPFRFWPFRFVAVMTRIREAIWHHGIWSTLVRIMCFATWQQAIT